MSRYMESGNLLGNIDDGVEERCSQFEGGSYYSQWLLQIAVSWPVLLTAFTFAFSIRTRDIFFSMLSFMLLADFLINMGLRVSIGQSSPDPECGGDYAMPAYVSEHTGLFVTTLLLMNARWSVPMGLTHCLLVFAVLYIAIYSRLFVGGNSRWQLISGSVVGVGLSVLFTGFYYWVVFPHVDWIISSWIGRYLQLESVMTSWFHCDKMISMRRTDPQRPKDV